MLFRTGVAACAGAAVLLLCARPMWRATPAARAALYLGKIACGVSLWHLPVLFLLGQHMHLKPVVALAIAVPVTLALAALSWHLVKQPLLRRWAGRAMHGVPVPQESGL